MAALVYTYCPRCATALEARMMSDRVRPICPACGFIQFHDPKVAVIGLVTCGEHVLLTQRAVNPEMGKWTLPGGFMDAGEMPMDALQRELMEEIALPVVVNELIEILPMLVDDADAPGGQANRGIVLAFGAHPRSGQPEPLQAHDDVQDARWFTRGNTPANLAFESTHKLIARWCDR
ncbi:MAG: NUDIX hydrolase [Caldilineaceae bacterium]